VRWAKDDLPIENLARRMAIPALLVASALLVLRCTVLRSFAFGTFECLFDKVAFGGGSAIRFRSDCGAARPVSDGCEAIGDPSSGDAGPSLASGLLRSPALLLPGTRDYGRCLKSERVAANRTGGSNAVRPATDREDLLQDGNKRGPPNCRGLPSQGSHVRLKMMLPKPAAQRWLTPARERPSQSRSNR
jgi:hypothetical protein